jgi:hypothetical protein
MWDVADRNRGPWGVCCPAWKYQMVARTVAGSLPSESTTEWLGAYGVDDVGTIYDARTLLQRNAKDAPITWHEWEAGLKRYRE